MIKELIFSKLEIYNFHNLNMIKRLKSPLFHEIINITTNKSLGNQSNSINNPININKIYSVTYVPSFVKVTISNNFKKFSYNRFNSFLMDLENFHSAQDYFSNQFGPKSRSKIRSNIKRLETCFNINYKFYFGNIELQVYQSLCNALETMIKRRFNQRGNQHEGMQDWDFYKKTIYQGIINKNISLFVIYDNNKPIDISVNYHYDNILINSIRAYDIDYSKFKLGNIDIFRQLEWCFENNIKLFDLGPGILTYKKQWCNVNYYFRNYIIYNRKSIISSFLALILLLFYKLKIFLDKHNLLIDKDNSNHDSVNNKDNDFIIQETPFELIDIVKPKKEDLLKNFKEINFESEQFKFLRIIIYNYLYLSFDQKNKIKVYSINYKSNSYIILGKKSLKLILND